VIGQKCRELLERRWRAQISALRSRQGIWRYSRAAQFGDPRQGWKLHVSATILSAGDAYARVSPILREHRAFFKVPAELRFLAELNSGAGGYSQIGKFVTVYTTSSDEASILAAKLHAATRGVAAPRIPFDARYRRNGLVYYRYGAFTPGVDGKRSYILDAKGKPYLDRCGPGRAVPHWAKDPFQSQRRLRRRKSSGPIGLEYVVRKALAQRGKGGVFEALDLAAYPARLVVIKQGRRHGDTDWDGDDGFARVKREGRTLRQLRVAGIPVPEPFREFRRGGDQFLVLEKIPGRALLPRLRQQPQRPSCRAAMRILDELGPLLSKLHAAGWVWRDCKPPHIFRHGGAIRLIDFEGACLIDETDVLPWGSPNYVPPIYHGKFSRRPGTLEDDYALGVIAFQFATGEFPPLGSRRRHALFHRTGCPDFLRVKIESLLRY
jgi:class IV lanthipeptide synthase